MSQRPEPQKPIVATFKFWSVQTNKKMYIVQNTSLYPAATKL